MSDVTIPAAAAKDIAALMRTMVRNGEWPLEPGKAVADYWADLLDPLPPPPPSLRDEAIEALGDRLSQPTPYEDLHGVAVDTVLAVVRRHVEGLPGTRPDSMGWLLRDDVLRMLETGDE